MVATVGTGRPRWIPKACVKPLHINFEAKCTPLTNKLLVQALNECFRSEFKALDVSFTKQGTLLTADEGTVS
jgi:hypothetical protein